jgi:trans-aconitate 2-methyltransferase
MWDAAQYQKFNDERGRPFFDLLARIDADKPAHVVDLGCGPGNLTVALAGRWPGAEVTGVDSSPEMIEAAQALAGPRLAFALGDVRDWQPAATPDVIISNAVLQWVPAHDDLVVRWADQLAPGGWLALQLPGNFDSPAHDLVKRMARTAPWRSLLGGATVNRQAGSPGGYVRLLARDGYAVDAWETTYLHVLPDEAAVVEWAKGTTLRPVLSLLDAGQQADFLTEYADQLRGAYESGPFGVIFPFRRVFTVAHRL